MRTPEVKSLLRARFCSPEWAIFFEVGDGTGSAQRRWADAVAMNMYPSRGLEIQVSKSRSAGQTGCASLKTRRSPHQCNNTATVGG